MLEPFFIIIIFILTRGTFVCFSIHEALGYLISSNLSNSYHRNFITWMNSVCRFAVHHWERLGNLVSIPKIWKAKMFCIIKNRLNVLWDVSLWPDFLIYFLSALLLCSPLLSCFAVWSHAICWSNPMMVCCYCHFYICLARERETLLWLP